MELYALAEGVLGPLTWVQEHWAAVSEIGQLLPGFTGPRGYGGDLNKASTLLPEVVSANKLRSAWSSLLAAEPLALSPAQIKEHAFRGHSMHGTLADLARFIGPKPHPTVGLDGFGYEDTRELGHWQRDKNEPIDADAAARAADSRGDDPPPTGAPTLQGAQALRYSSGAGRMGERSRQITVRGRIVNWMRLVLMGVPGGWKSLIPHVRAAGSDWEVLFPERVSLAALPRMLPPPRA